MQRGAFLNVKINAAGLKDTAKAQELIAKGADIEAEAARLEQEILVIVESKI